MKWSLVISNRGKRQYRRIPASDRNIIDVTILEMCEDPFSGDVKRLRGSDGLRRRVGDWRILYKLDADKNVIVLTAIKRRGSNTY